MIPIHGSLIEARQLSTMYEEPNLGLLNLDVKFARDSFIHCVHGSYFFVLRVHDNAWFDIGLRKMNLSFELNLHRDTMCDLAADLRKPFGDSAKFDQVGMNEDQTYSSDHHSHSRLRYLVIRAISGNCPGDQVLQSLYCLHPALKSLAKGYKLTRNYVTGGLFVQKHLEETNDVVDVTFEELFTLLYRT